MIVYFQDWLKEHWEEISYDEKGRNFETWLNDKSNLEMVELFDKFNMGE